MASRVVFHIDINAFFASAHLILDPTLQGKPVVVCRDVSGSVVTTASYEARAYGINSAMPLSQAKKLCNTLVVVELDFEWYTELSEQFVDIVRKYSDKIQQASIDEVYVDVSIPILKYEKPLDMAVAIQKEILDTLKLPVSIGVAPNKFLAKMASDMQKPLGITVLRIREVAQKLWPLPIEEMHGIGKKTVPRLKVLGIHTIGDLNRVSFDDLKPILGNRTQDFIDKSNGIDVSGIESGILAKSIGQSKTFHAPIYDLDELKSRIMIEISEVERRAKDQRLLGKTVQFSIRLENMKTAARSVSFDSYINDKDTILERVMSLYSEFEGEGGVSFISVTLSNLIAQEDLVEQIDLFNIDKTLSVEDVIHELNHEIDSKIFMKASALLNSKGNRNE